MRWSVYFKTNSNSVAKELLAVSYLKEVLGSEKHTRVTVTKERAGFYH